MSFKHLTSADRVVIATLLDEDRSPSYIARRLGTHRSTVSREIKRNQLKPKPRHLVLPVRPAILDTDCRHSRGHGVAQDKYETAERYTQQLAAVRLANRYYVAREATRRAKARRHAANTMRTRLVYSSGSWLEQYVRRRLTRDQWSPEQIAGDLKRNHKLVIHPPTIYGYISAAPDKKQLVRHLRHGGNPYRHKHGTNARSRARQAALPSIHDRPKIVDERTRVGDLEGDTIVGLDHRDRIATHVDRACGECTLDLVLQYNAVKLTDRTSRSVKQHVAPTHTITYDRGNEFADYERLAKRTGADVYFADAYHSWERGSNENLNGLVRQYFPKRYDFKKITPRQLAEVERKLNNRPRKRYNYRTPIEQRQYLLSQA